jgi:hypothetical protein
LLILAGLLMSEASCSAGVVMSAIVADVLQFA